MTEYKPPMKVLAYFDGRPGHEKQTRGILYELGRLVNLKVVETRVERKGLAGSIAELAGLLAARNAKGTKDHQGIDLLIGTGSSTHVPMLRNKKIAGIPAVTCMAPASYLRPSFDLCFVPLHDGVREGGNIFTTIGPPNCSRPSGVKDPCRGHNRIGNMLGLADEFFGAWRVWDAIRGLDYLLSRPEADPSRVGATGASGGGTLTTYLSAVDPRLTMAAPSSYITTFLCNLESEMREHKLL